MSHVRDIEKVTYNWKKKSRLGSIFYFLSIVNCFGSSCNRLQR